MLALYTILLFFFFQAEDGIRDFHVTGVQTCALPICEVGIRMALGAQGAQVLRLIFRQGLWQIAIGLPLGLALAMVMASGAKIILFDVQPLDLPIYLGVVVVLSAVGLAACLVPARRATRVDPLVALHSD